jgi:uncharacterized protein (TIGR02147 family)
LFEFDNYLEFLKNYFASEFAKKGAKSAFAKACGIQTSYLSQIFAGKTQLSPEQALRGSEYLELNALETQYFVLLVQKARAGSVDFKKFCDNQLAGLRAEQSKLSARLEKTSKLSEQASQKYYSSWIYRAIHMIFSLPHVHTLKEATELLNEDPDLVSEAAEFLMSEGMIVKTPEGYETRPAQIHLSSDSPLIRQHHTNWRVKSLASIQKNDSKDLHYSVTFTLSQKDADRIRENLLQVVRDNLKIVAPSPEEVMYTTTLDFFKLA